MKIYQKILYTPLLFLLFFSIAQAELVGLWHLDEGTGLQTADSSTYGYNGTLVGAQWSSGYRGNALQFDGVNDYLRIGNQPALDMDTTMTLSAWIFPTGPGGGGYYGGIIINKEGEYEIARCSDGQITWAITHGGTSWNWTMTGLFAPLNTWTHIALVYDGASVKTYGNGVLAHTYAMTGSIGHESSYPTTYEFWIGARQAGFDQYFQGKIDEVSVFNTALSQSQIQSLDQVPEISCWLLALSGIVFYSVRKKI